MDCLSGPLETSPAAREKAARIGDFLTDRVNIGSKAVRRHHAGVEVAVGALGLAERHLDVNAEIFPLMKTLAHAKTGRSESADSRLRLGRLRERRDGGDHLWRQRLEIELLGEKGDAVAAGFGVEGVRRVVELELLGFAGQAAVALARSGVRNFSWVAYCKKRVAGAA